MNSDRIENHLAKYEVKSVQAPKLNATEAFMIPHRHVDMKYTL